jgi:two-component system response regulator AtoC
MPHATIIDDDPDFLEAISEVVRQHGFSIETARTLAEARSLLAARIPDLALIDLSLPDGDGSQLLRQLSDVPTDVVMITGHATVDSAVKALRDGAVDYLTKPVDVQRLQAILVNVARRRELSEQVDDLRNELRRLGRFGALVGASPSMQDLYDLIARVAPTNATVLVQGESGTGKEVVAQTIHQISRRRKSPFVALNCGAVSPQLIESELFGHERGSFTGADRQHRGYFERAGGGTLFLDEVTEMPLELQVKLLRTLESGTVVRIGGEKELPVDVRIIAATNRNPHEAVEAVKFRADLLYRLSVFPLQLPPLRDRGADIDLLAETFLAQMNREEKANKALGRGALDLLRRYHWPGNVRELKNVMHRAFILADQEIDASCLPTLTGDGALDAPPPAGATATGPTIVLRPGTSIADAERRLIFATLEAYDGNKEQAARILGISLKTLYNRLNAYSGRAKAKDAPVRTATGA